MKNRRIVITRRGGPGVLKLVEEEIPEPEEGEVRVHVRAAGVAFADILMREGLYPKAPAPPFTPGYDVVGIVDKPGEGVTGIEPGQMVAALTKVGGYTDYICLPQDDLVPVDGQLDAGQAVCLVLNYLTAYQMLHRVAHVTDGERMLVHGAAGGVGTALLQLGALSSLEVYGTASSPKHQAVRELGGIPIDYRKDDFVAKIRELTGKGVDVVFDPIGGRNWKRSFKTLRRGGRLVCYGFSSTISGGRRDFFRALRSAVEIPRFSPLAMIGKNLMVAGYNVAAMKARRPEWYRQDLETLFELLAEEKIKPVIAERIWLEEAARAHKLLGKGKVTGKIVLVCGA
ncbi:MAG TPA: medium chain dehydrogenase/reductase family protein [archaeon]|nr:medium chain dehydrogenase/reductase family protein [archaeon]